jgi:hypothetical protein
MSHLSGPLPANLKSWVGTENYYKKRHQDFVARHADLPAPDYYLGYGDRYMHRFVDELSPSLSKGGQEWILRTRAGLQAAIENERARDPAAFDKLEQDSERFRQFCYGSHPGVYVDSGIGALSPLEWTQVIMTPDVKDLMNRPGVCQMVDTTKRLVVQRAHDDFAKVQQRSPAVAGALAGVHRMLLPVATRAADDVALLARPLQPLTERIAQTAESVALACAPMLEPLRQGFLASANQVAAVGHHGRVKD